MISRKVKQLITSALVIALSFSLGIPFAASAADTPSLWAADSISKAISLNLLPQELQGKYTQAMTRAEFCSLTVILYEKIMAKEISDRIPFNDTNDVYVEKAAAIGVVLGVSDGRFNPGGQLSREQAATMLARLSEALGMPLVKKAATFDDNSSISSWAIERVGQMQASGIMSGTGNNKFTPKGSYSREQSVITFIRVYDRAENPALRLDYKSWALGCSAILAKRNGFEPYQFGMFSNSFQNRATVKSLLSRDWSCSSREDLIALILRMTDNGHNESFAEAYYIITTLSKEEYEYLLKSSGDVDAYMWPLTKALGEKWGDKQIKAWDWFRMIHLAGWGYIAGYFSLEEAHEYMAPVIERLSGTFSSWEEACDNYMDGYAWWSRTDVSKSGTEYERRLGIYQGIKNDEILFDPTVWG